MFIVIFPLLNNIESAHLIFFHMQIRSFFALLNKNKYEYEKNREESICVQIFYPQHPNFKMQIIIQNTNSNPRDKFRK